MSVRAMSLVWDMQCPSKIGEKDFKPGHKYVLLAYADHADHNGRNIYPAVSTVARKTGYEDRTIQRLTRDMEEMGILVDDGMGPRGQHRWYIPISARGDKLSPLTNCQGDIPSGDIPSGDIPSGVNLSPELNKGTQEFDISIIDKWSKVLAVLKNEMPKASFETWVRDTQAEAFDGRTLTVGTRNGYAKDWLDERIKDRAQELSGYYVEFVCETESQPVAV